MNEEEIAEAAAALPTAARGAYLDVACAGHPDVRARLEALLDSHEATGFMEVNTALANDPDLRENGHTPPPEQSGQQIGHHQLVEAIGESGFGVVWLADQLEPVRRQVAVKIIKPGMDSREVIGRFEQERQAVQHAHQKGIIHRDLKPSNILVTADDDGTPGPKVLKAHPLRRAHGTFVIGASLAFLAMLALANAGPVYEPLAGFEALAPDRAYDASLFRHSDGNFYGTSRDGGAHGGGTIYRVTAVGEFSILAHFGGSIGGGYSPRCALISDGNGFLWGTTGYGGSRDYGTIFKVSVSTGVVTKVGEFTGDSGAVKGYYPHAGLVDDGNGYFWGTTRFGGTADNGTVFKLNVLTGAMTTVIKFTGDAGPAKGRNPVAAMIRGDDGFLWGTTETSIFKVETATGVLTSVPGAAGCSTGTLVSDGCGHYWGTTQGGGTANFGTVFKLDAYSGTRTTVAEFGGFDGPARGMNPECGLVSDGNGFLWGTTRMGGTRDTGIGNGGEGTVFKVNMATGELTTVVDFTGFNGAAVGVGPVAGLTHDGNGFLWGITSGILGSNGFGPWGTVYKVKITTGELTTVVRFGGDIGSVTGVGPMGGFADDGNGFLWGVTAGGGAANHGTIFKMDPVTGALTTMAEFTGSGAVNGSAPVAGLTGGPNGFLWGTTVNGGARNLGTIFKIDSAKGTLTEVASFTGATGGAKGAHPEAGLVADGNGYLWGSTRSWGLNSENDETCCGSIYKVSAATGVLTTVVQFTGTGGTARGSYPRNALLSDGSGHFWGTTWNGGTGSVGTVFKVNATTGTLTTVVEFTGNGGIAPGGYPTGALVKDNSGAIWGMTLFSAPPDNGPASIFKINPVTGEPSTFLKFTGTGGAVPGVKPESLMSDPSGVLWGMTTAASWANFGTIFKIDAGGNFTHLMDFTGISGSVPGDSPWGPLSRYRDGNLYGATGSGGLMANGRIGGGGQIFRLRFGPTPVTLPAERNGATSARLYGTINPNGNATVTTFEWGTDPELSDFTSLAAGTVPAGNFAEAVSAIVAGLDPGTNYYYRVVGVNAENAQPQRGAIVVLEHSPTGPALTGSVDPRFHPELDGRVASVAVQPDGKILIAGEFTSVEGQVRNRIARLNSDGALDAAFNPGTGTNRTVLAVAVRDDGRILVTGSFTSIDDQPRNRVALLNADGTLAGTDLFNPGSGADDSVDAIAVQEDGKILLGGAFTSFNGQERKGIARLQPDGTLEDSATFVSGDGPNERPQCFAVQADGKIISGGAFTTFNREPRAGIARLLPDGALESAAAFNNSLEPLDEVTGVLVQPDGKILIGGSFVGYPGIARLQPNGALESRASFNPRSERSRLNCLALQTDGKILTGENSEVDGQLRHQIGRLHSNGTPESIATFQPGTGPNGAAETLAMQADGKILAGGGFTLVNGQVRNRMARLQNDQATASLEISGLTGARWMRGGSSPEVSCVTFDVQPARSSAWERIGRGQRILGGWELTGITLPHGGTLRARGRAGGSLLESTAPVPVPPDMASPASGDPSFHPALDIDVGAIAVQADGGIIVGGTRLDGTTATMSSLVRLRSNGSLDSGFSAGVDGRILCVGIEADGDVIAGGSFSSVFGAARYNFARFRPDGTLDTGFVPQFDERVFCLALQPDGKVVIGGGFGSVTGTSRPFIARLEADGSVDAGFNPGANATVLSLAIQEDGKILLGGAFTSIAGAVRNYVARLHPDGTLDAGFNPNAGSAVHTFAVQADGKIIAGGDFTSMGGVARNRLARLEEDGSVDQGFNPNVEGGTIRTLSVQTDRRILTGGSFSSVGGLVRRRFAWLNPDGSPDAGIPNIDVCPDPDSSVVAIALQADGKVLVGGMFSSVGGLPRRNLSRMRNYPATGSLENTETSSVRWLRSGSSPEVVHVTFDLKPQGAEDWTPLGNGHHTAGGWELSGLTLPPAGEIRARGRAGGSLYESVEPIRSELELWRLEHFGSSANTATAADQADPDFDGIPNLVEYALGLDPNQQSVGGLPNGDLTGDELVLSITQPAGVSGITYSAERSATLLASSWSPVPDTGTPPEHTFRIRLETNQTAFLRLKVTAP